uniref:WD40 protein n=1 Tax=Lonicera caerulea TaxID=134520 RepID=A0A0U3E2C5_9DIPS|nr:WD40 protein [Lonicera caerulea]
MSSPSPQIALTCSPDGHITAYTTSSATAASRFSGSHSPRNGIAILGKKHIAASHVSGTSAGAVHLYNWWSSTPYHRISVPEPVAPLSATSDGQYLFAGGISGHIHAFSLPAGDLVRSFPAHSKPISCFEINGDGSLLISGSNDGTVAIFPVYKLLSVSSSWSSISDVILHRLIGHESSVTAITIGIGGINSTVISCSLDCTCKFWSLMHGTHLNTVTFPCAVWGIVMDTMESEFYAAGSDGSVYSGGLAGQPWKHELNPVAWERKHVGPIVAIATINYGQNLLTASEEGDVWIWDLETRVVVKVLADKEMGSISGLVVAKGFDEVCGNGNGRFGGWNLGLYVEEVSRPMREVMEMGVALNGAVEDRSRAINNLESAMGIYEKMLELLLKEVMAGNSGDDGHGGDEDKAE